MVKVALVVRLVAKAGKEEAVRAFLAGAEPLAVGESFTPAWFALRTEPSVFYIVDAIASEDASRNAKTWEAVVRKLATRQMPPADSMRPSGRTTSTMGVSTLSGLSRFVSRL